MPSTSADLTRTVLLATGTLDAIWWDVDAASEAEALELLPSYIAERTTVVAVATVEIP